MNITPFNNILVQRVARRLEREVGVMVQFNRMYSGVCKQKRSATTDGDMCHICFSSVSFERWALSIATNALIIKFWAQ